MSYSLMRMFNGILGMPIANNKLFPKQCTSVTNKSGIRMQFYDKFVLLDVYGTDKNAAPYITYFYIMKFALNDL